MGPAGWDLGTLEGSLLLAWLSARGQVAAGEREVARGGYARYTAAAKVERWLGVERDLMATACGFWEAWVGAFVRAWGGEWEGVEESRREGGLREAAEEEAAARNPSEGRVPMEKWNATPPTPLWRTQSAYLGGVLADALGFAGASLCAAVASPGIPLEFTSLPSSSGACDLAAAKAGVLGGVLLRAGAEIARRCVKAAVRAGSEDEGEGSRALEVLGGAWEVVRTAAAAVDDHVGWKTLQGTSAATSKAGSNRERVKMNDSLDFIGDDVIASLLSP